MSTRTGIIPARAGFTPAFDSQCQRGLGSSPLARGLPGLARPAGQVGGIIPARAGFTTSAGPSSRVGSDHPRSRGVYSTPGRAAGIARGSSPLARGLPTPSSGPDLLARIIPARAGFTPGSGGRWPPPPDHPRSRGVYLPRGGAVLRVEGSSPLARGLLPHTYYVTRTIRIIPARAGFTAQAATAAAVSEDHPRSRGVYCRALSWFDPHVGSSPLARGLREEIISARAATRIIPARAGFTWVGRG